MAPVTPCAYSGLAISRASDAATAACSARTGSGSDGSRSGLKSGKSPTPRKIVNSISGGARRCAARSNAELMDAARRLPEMPKTFMSANQAGDAGQSKWIVTKTQREGSHTP